MSWVLLLKGSGATDSRVVATGVKRLAQCLRMAERHEEAINIWTRALFLDRGYRMVEILKQGPQELVGVRRG